MALLSSVTTGPHVPPHNFMQQQQQLAMAMAAHMKGQIPALPRVPHGSALLSPPISCIATAMAAHMKGQMVQQIPALPSSERKALRSSTGGTS